MRRTRYLAVAVAAVLGLAGCSDPGTASGSGGSSHLTQPSASDPAVSPALAQQVAAVRLATVKYVHDLPAAERDGYQIITPMMPDMGYHYLNPGIQGFDVTKPPILVYVKGASGWQLGAVEWVWPKAPTTPPMEGATYGSFAAACHFKDGRFVPAGAESDCPRTSAEGSPFSFWHPDLTTLHVWVWFHNPAGLYHGTNPLVRAYNPSGLVTGEARQQ